MQSISTSTTSTDPLNNLPSPTNWKVNMPRVYVLQEVSFNGAWIDAINASEMQKNMDYIQHHYPFQRPVKVSLFQNFEGTDLAPEMPISFIAQIGEGIRKYGKAFLLYYADYPREPEILSNFREDYRGSFDRIEDFVKEILSKEAFDAQLQRNNLDWKHINFDEIIRDWFCPKKGIYRRILDEKIYIFKRR
ncbi:MULTISPECIES: hypothetical protein [unclassified Microcoleus]|uniref:hypothetical protein n=1 Tax=unclassified Microcoleus TaxID=2642155 RepID=UPI002FCFB46D